MLKKLSLFAAILSLGIAPITAYAQDSEESSAEISETTPYLSELVTLKEGTYRFVDAYLTDDPLSDTEKSVVFFIEFTNTSEEAHAPRYLFTLYIDPMQEVEGAETRLSAVSTPDREGISTYDNGAAELKAGEKIIFEVPVALQSLETEVAVVATSMTDKKDETLFTVNPAELADLPAEEIDFSNLEGDESSESEGEDEGEESDILGEIESEDGLVVIKEAFIYEDDYADSGYSLLILAEFTNNSGAPLTPSLAFNGAFDITQETEKQIHRLYNGSGPYERNGIETNKNYRIDLKDGQTIEFETSVELTIEDSEVIFSSGYMTSKEGEKIFALNPQDLETLSLD